MLYSAAPDERCPEVRNTAGGSPRVWQNVPERGSARSSTAAAQAALLPACLLVPYKLVQAAIAPLAERRLCAKQASPWDKQSNSGRGLCGVRTDPITVQLRGIRPGAPKTLRSSILASGL